MGVSKATVSRVLRRAGLSNLSAKKARRGQLPACSGGLLRLARREIQRVITDNPTAFHPGAFGRDCGELGIAQKFTRAYRPQTNGKAERFIQSALRERA